MTNEQQRQKLDLEFLEGTLSDAGFSTHLQVGNEQQPITVLSARPPGDEQVLQLIYIPSESFLEDSNLLQLYTVLPKPDEDNVVKELTPLLNAINTLTTIGYFSIANNGDVFYRYVYAMPRFEVPKASNFTELTKLFTFTFSHYRAIILDYQTGKTDLEKAISSLTE